MWNRIKDKLPHRSGLFIVFFTESQSYMLATFDGYDFYEHHYGTDLEAVKPTFWMKLPRSP